MEIEFSTNRGQVFMLEGVEFGKGMIYPFSRDGGSKMDFGGYKVSGVRRLVVLHAFGRIVLSSCQKGELALEQSAS